MYGSGKEPNKLKAQKQSEEDNIIKNKTNIFKLKIENKTIKDRIIRDITTFFEPEDDYYKPIKVGKFLNKNYIEYESNGDRKNTYQ